MFHSPSREESKNSEKLKLNYNYNSREISLICGIIEFRSESSGVSCFSKVLKDFERPAEVKRLECVQYLYFLKMQRNMRKA